MIFVNRSLVIILLSIPFGLFICDAQEAGQKLDISFSTGSQHENFNWSIAGNTNGQNPNVFSELKWENVSGQAYNAALQWQVWQRFLFYADYNRVTVHSGALSDMDYSGDNRTSPAYSETFSDNKGYTTGYNVGAGYNLFHNNRFSLVPFGGYTNNSQYLYIVDLTGQFPDLNSSYFAHWKGWFIKLKPSLKITRRLDLSADITYSQLNYTAQGDWNLITQFQHPLSYSHVADGYGFNADGKLSFTVTKNVSLTVNYSYFNWRTGTGFDYAYLASGNTDKTQLNGVFRKGYQFAGGLNLFW